MPRAILYPLSVLFLVASGCASMETRVVARAAHDFTCGREQTVITDQFGGIYRVSGCGFTASYECQENGSLVVSCQAIEGTQVVATHAANRD